MREKEEEGRRRGEEEEEEEEEEEKEEEEDCVLTLHSLSSSIFSPPAWVGAPGIWGHSFFMW